MSNTELVKLNQKYGIRDQLVFAERPGGFIVAEIKNPHGEATVALHGGHIMSFRPRDHEPVLWLSSNSHFKTGKAIRGGIPVCWPWFADHPTDTDKPAHGFVRAAAWSVSESEKLEDESTRLKLFIADSEETMKLWPHRFRLEIDITVSDVLRTKLISTNVDNKPFRFGGALHSYFNISSISNIMIKGLEGCPYLDKVDQGRRKVQDGSVSVKSETDRIYLDTKADCIIEDSGMHRSIGISKNGSRTTVVWNPWIDKAREMKDFGDGEYKSMVCVETANAGTDVISLAPGDTHTLESIIRLESLTS
ncbi:MAG: D-hexose-6-phosphate mutarotase [Syntrophobacteria bacterium]